jgi:chromosome segregation ATPase
MNRLMTSLNFVGVLVLTVLCIIQWQANSQFNAQLNRANQTRLDQAAKLVEQEATLNQNATDLADVRQRLSLAEVDLKDAQDKLAASEQQCNGLIAQRDQLKTTLDKWEAAIADRDRALKQAGDQIQTLTADRNQAVQKFNDLADKYNAVVKQLNNK